MDWTKCDIYGCRQPAQVNSNITTVIDGETVTLEVCEDHKAFFQATPASNYNIGRTFTGEIEVRRVPRKPESPTTEA